MFVCVSTECFPNLPLDQAMERLAELEFTAVEIDIHEGGTHLQPEDVLELVERARHLTPAPLEELGVVGVLRVAQRRFARGGR